MPQDLINLCKSYLDFVEIIYYEKEWNKFPQDDRICFIAVDNNWLDLLKWSIVDNNMHYDKWLCAHAAGKCKIEILKWLRENKCKCDGVFHLIEKLI